MKNAILKFTELSSKLKDLSLLCVRLILAYGFWGPSLKKLQNPDGMVKFFEKIDIPFPLFNVYLSGVTEFLGAIFLLVGFGTRIISIPLMITMVVAIYTVHWDAGWPATKGGIQIPLYFIIMLFILLTNGSGKLSIDHFIGKKFKN